MRLPSPPPRLVGFCHFVWFFSIVAMPRVILKNIHCWMSTQVFLSSCLSLGICNKIIISPECVVAFEYTTPQCLLPKMGEREKCTEGKDMGPLNALEVASACRGGYCNLGLQHVCVTVVQQCLFPFMSVPLWLEVMISNPNTEPGLRYSLGLAYPGWKHRNGHEPWAEMD